VSIQKNFFNRPTHVYAFFGRVEKNGNVFGKIQENENVSNCPVGNDKNLAKIRLENSAKSRGLKK
jgi:hypothetical protein